jgi:hypothetical protein
MFSMGLELHIILEYEFTEVLAQTDMQVMQGHTTYVHCVQCILTLYRKMCTVYSNLQSVQGLPLFWPPTPTEFPPPHPIAMFTGPHSSLKSY